MQFMIKKKEGGKAVMLTGQPNSPKILSGADPTSEGIEPETIAVILAAIEAYESSADEFFSNIHIRGIDRTSGMRPAWGAAGTADSIEMRRQFSR
jgi:hypothetical protein